METTNKESRLTTLQIAEQLKDLLVSKTNIPFEVVEGKRKGVYSVQGPIGTMTFGISEEQDSIVYMIDVVADAPSVLEMVLFLIEEGLNLVYGGAYAVDIVDRASFVFGEDAYRLKNEWLKVFAKENESSIIRV